MKHPGKERSYSNKIKYYSEKGKNELTIRIKGCRALHVSMFVEMVKRDEQTGRPFRTNTKSASFFQHGSHCLGCGPKNGIKKKKKGGKEKNMENLVRQELR